MGLLKCHKALWQAIERLFKSVVDAIDYGVASAAIGPLALVTKDFLGALYNHGMLWPVVRFLLTAAGWWVAFKVVAKILEWVFAPEAEIVELIASTVVWVAQTVLAIADFEKKCC